MMKSLLSLTQETPGLMPMSRRYLLAHLKTILEYATHMATTQQTPSAMKPKWARISVAAASAAASILQDEGLESLAARVEELERANR